MTKRNQTAQGKRYVGKIIKKHEKSGYPISWKPSNKAIRLPGGRMVSASQDILEAFDVMFIKDGILTMVQSTKDDRNAWIRRKKVEALDLEPANVNQAVYSFVPRGGFRVWVLQSDRTWLLQKIGIHDLLPDDFYPLHR